jgi:hypothetical protein
MRHATGLVRVRPRHDPPGPAGMLAGELRRRSSRSMGGSRAFVPLFNGKDLSGWKGLVADPPTRAR